MKLLFLATTDNLTGPERLRPLVSYQESDCADCLIPCIIVLVFFNCYCYFSCPNQLLVAPSFLLFFGAITPFRLRLD